MQDKIFIEKLRVPCIIGIFDWERKIKQTIEIDFEIPANIRKAAKSDHIQDAVDYKKITKHVIQFVSKSNYQLVETLAEELAASILKSFRIREILLRISKPGALRHAKNVGVQIHRKQ